MLNAHGKNVKEAGRVPGLVLCIGHYLRNPDNSYGGDENGRIERSEEKYHAAGDCYEL